MARFSDVEGVVPWIPAEIDDVDKDVWTDGLRFERKHCVYNREPSDLNDALRIDRTEALLELFKATWAEPWHVKYEAMVTIDHLLLSQGKLPDNISMIVAVASCYVSRAMFSKVCISDLSARLAESLALPHGTNIIFHAFQIEQMLGSFAVRDMVHTPLDWLLRYASVMPEVIQKQVMEARIDVIFSVIGAVGSLAHHKPSSVAAAVLVHILKHQAGPYLCGYDLRDVETALAEIRMLLDRCM